MVIPYYLIYAKIGLIGSYGGVILAYLSFNLSFYIWVLRSFCQDIPRELEDAATAEISRAQLWQWLRNPAAQLENGSRIDSTMYRAERSRILDDLLQQAGAQESAQWVKAAELMDRLVLNDEFATFLTLEAYQAIS